MSAQQRSKPQIPDALKPFNAFGGLTLYAPSPADAQAEAHSNEAEQIYFGKFGVKLQEGDVVLDLGANVGAFARVAAPILGDSGVVYAVEPVPALVEALRINTRLFEEWARKKGVPVARVVPVEAGCAAPGAPETAPFTYYPRITAFTTMHPDDADAAAATLSLVVNRRECYSAAEAAGKLLARCAPALYRRLHAALFVRMLLRPAVRVDCRLTTVSAIIEEHGIGEVALLKANVERAEWDALLGVSDDHWPRVRQASLQVHDIGGRVAAVEALLRSKGFDRVTVYKEPRFADCSLFMVYATREEEEGGRGASAAAGAASAGGRRGGIGGGGGGGGESGDGGGKSGDGGGESGDGGAQRRPRRRAAAAEEEARVPQ